MARAGPAEASGEQEWQDEVQKLAEQLLMNPETDLSLDSVNNIVDAGVFTPTAAQTFFGNDTAYHFDGPPEDSGKEQVEFLKTMKSRLQDKRETLLGEVKEEQDIDSLRDLDSVFQSMDSTQDTAAASAAAASVGAAAAASSSSSSQPGGGGDRTLDFDVEKLMADDLREELKIRGLPHSGPKATLIKRLCDAVKTRPDIATHRMTKKRKRPNNKREPAREEFETEELYQAAWQKWRETRDNNNMSVKRSRENARAKKAAHEQLCKVREDENRMLTDEVQQLREQVSFLTKVLKSPDQLADHEQQLLEALVHPLNGEDDAV